MLKCLIDILKKKTSNYKYTYVNDGVNKRIYN